MMELVLVVLMMVESGGDPNALGDPRTEGGETVYKARGAFQIWEVYWEDGCRILGREAVGEWSYEKGSMDPEKSKVIVRAYLTHYGKRYTRITGKPPTFEVYCRMHNGGPNGFRKRSTRAYWEKAKRWKERIERGKNKKSDR